MGSLKRKCANPHQLVTAASPCSGEPMPIRLTQSALDIR